jgi:hypothetical protein
VPVNHKDMASNSATESKKRTRREDVSRRASVTTDVAINSTLQLFAFAKFHHVGGINRLAVNLDVSNLAVFIDQETHAAADLSLFVIETVLVGNFAAQITQQREGNFELVFPSLIAEGTIHADTQDLGICSFQPLQVLLEVLHFLGSTSGKGKNVKGKRDVFLALEAAQGDSGALIVGQGKVRSLIPDFQSKRGRAFLFLLCPNLAGSRNSQREHPQHQQHGS